MLTTIDSLNLLSGTTSALSTLLKTLNALDLDDLTLTLELLSERLIALETSNGDLNQLRGALLDLLGAKPAERAALLQLLDLLLDNHRLIATDELLSLSRLLREGQLKA